MGVLEWAYYLRRASARVEARTVSGKPKIRYRGPKIMATTEIEREMMATQARAALKNHPDCLIRVSPDMRVDVYDPENGKGTVWYATPRTVMG